MDKIRAYIKFLLSFGKSDWTLYDYPIRLRSWKIDPTIDLGHRKAIPFSAQVINWSQMEGHGDSENEAVANLAKSFETYKNSHDNLPRPGTGAPIEFATTAVVDKNEAIARDFLERILGFDYDQVFISDESSLWDFHSAKSNDDYYRKISLLYGVDVSDIDGAKLSQIFERINESRRNLTRHCY